MRILLIWPPSETKAALPLSYMYMPQALRGHEVGMMVVLGDATENEFVQEVANYKPDVVGISAWSSSWQNAKIIAKEVKQISSNIVTICGGPHVTLAPEQVPELDYIVLGEGETVISELVNTLKNGGSTDNIKGIWRPKKQNHITRIANLDDLGLPDYNFIGLGWHLNFGYRYRNKANLQAPIITTRGCPYTCKFCCAPLISGRKIRYHSIEYLEKLLLALRRSGIWHINIVDDNFTFNIEYAKEFCQMVLANPELNSLSFATPNGIRVERSDIELFHLMRKTGWNRIIIAPETGSPSLLKSMGKYMDLDKVPEWVRQIHDADMSCEAFFILGYPGENQDTIEETRSFIGRCDFDDISIHIFQPLPGSPIRKELEASGKINYKETTTRYDLCEWIPEGLSASIMDDGIDLWKEEVYGERP